MPTKKNKTNRIKTNKIIYGVECPHCMDILVSRHRHDFKPCSCGKTAIDGGTDYMKVTFTAIPPKGVIITYAKETRRKHPFQVF